jgi:hypothetical protein
MVTITDGLRPGKDSVPSSIGTAAHGTERAARAAATKTRGPLLNAAYGSSLGVHRQWCAMFPPTDERSKRRIIQRPLSILHTDPAQSGCPQSPNWHLDTWS